MIGHLLTDKELALLIEILENEVSVAPTTLGFAVAIDPAATRAID
jgi:hypothetical protein